ncbi:hypothetical protein [Pseudomonas sichuanensis]|uniref:hypothetical protein n=1 Tax=Pseudomonas sichuanensis TaxID=2213015 RepID=UPI0013008980|nr:hypothetical protein [Pseudomonas sichuanensis]
MTRLLPLVLVLLAGCAHHPESRPAPTPVETPADCAAPAGLTGIDSSPTKPTGNYGQSAVAEYLVELHAWGAAGWARVEQIAIDSRDCQRLNKEKTWKSTGTQ